MEPAIWCHTSTLRTFHNHTLMDNGSNCWCTSSTGMVQTLLLLNKSRKVHMQCATERDLPAMNTPLVYLGSFSIGNPVGVQGVKVWKISFYWIHYPQMFC